MYFIKQTKGFPIKKILFLSALLLLVLFNLSTITSKAKTFLLDDNHGQKASLYYKIKTTQFKLFQNSKETKILMLGDSITDYGSWDTLFQRDDILNHGIIGDTTQGVLNRLQYINNTVEKAFIMIGINDIIVDKKVPYIFQNYKKIIQHLQKQGYKVYVQSTLYTGKSIADNYNDKVTQLNSLLIKYCKEQNIDFIDINQVLSTNQVMKDIYSRDDLHINPKGYQAWAKTIKSYI